MKKFKRSLIFWILSVIILLSPALSFPQSKASKQKLYTAYNFWKLPHFHRNCVNYKHGSNIIPVGTEVSNVKVIKEVKKGNSYKPGSSEIYGYDRAFISYKIVKTGKTIRVKFNPGWHPGKTIEEYKEMMFTTKPFNALVQGMTTREIEAIKRGLLIKGMSKRAVLVSYGPPPEHKTSNLNSDKWIYWINKMDTKAVHFNNDNKLIGGADFISDSGADFISDNCDIKCKLIKLRDLLEEGLITQEEHDKKKADLLEKF